MNKLKWAGVLLIFVSLAFASSDSDSSENGASYSQVTSKRYSNYIGVAAGFTSGYGLSYKKWFDKWGVQLTLFPWYEEEKYSDKTDDNSYYYNRDSGFSNNGYGSIGLLLNRSILESKYIKFCAYGGGNCYVEYKRYDYYSRAYDYSYGKNEYVLTHYTGKKLTNTLSLGVGCGAEFYIWRFGFHGMAGLRGSNRFPDNLKKIGLSAEAGAYFRF
jgi:hypothetical protein